RSFLPRSNQSHWLRIDGITERLLLQGQTKTMTYAYDSHGNVLQEVENNGVETITTTNAYGPFGGSIPNRLIRMDVNRQRAGQAPHLFSDRYNYNSKGQLTSKVDYSGLPHQVTTTYVYNDLGNVTIKTLSASGLAPRQTRKGYDSKGRFVINMTNPLGYSESATYGSKWGEKRSVTGIDGLTTTFDYDAFGRRTRTNLPTGVVINERFLFAVVPSYGSTYSHNISQVGKPDQWVYFDRLGRKLRHHRKSHANATVYEIWTFDSRGRLKTVRAPYKSGESTFTTTYQYDNYNRRISESNPFGTTSYVYSYSGGQSKVTKTDPAGQLSSVEMDASGQKTKATDNGGTLRYTYDSQGNIREIRLGNTVMVQMSHDVYGNKVQIVDKNAGTISYGYSPFKEMIHQTNANGHTYTMFYNACGKIIRRLGPGEDLHYTYHSTGAAKNKIANILNHQSPNGEYFYYDTFGRVNRKVDYIDGLYLSTFYTHNSFNDITSRLYPSGLKLDYAYDMNGFLSTIKHAASNQTLFTNQAMNGREQYTSYQLGNQQKTTIAYNQGVPFWYNAPGIQNLYLDWDYSSGNLNYRYDASKGQIEVFSYDNLNRLTSARVAGSPAKNVSFGTNGNINSKTDVGNYFYTSAKNNAVTRVTNPSRVIPTVRQNIRYTAFDQPDQLMEGNYELDYVYGHDRQRTKSVLQSNGAVETTRWYSGEYERQVTQSTTQEIHYVNAGQGTVAIVVKENNAFQFYYTYTDHLGSILAVTDAGGGVVAEQNFDPWGRKRNVFSWDYAGVGSVPDWLYRGYTGHEDMPEFGLINMNGRLYDPIVGRMLSVDNHIQSPSNTQSYNRYTYVFNNPLSYTDPSGELAWFVPVIIGATVGAYAGASIASNNWNFTKWEGDFWKGAIVGAFIGAAAGAMFAASVGAKGIIIP
ncbi:MAG: RHS repeat-associated core domain-containing protein, partial [Bacteroidota bacterium]